MNQVNSLRASDQTIKLHISEETSDTKLLHSHSNNTSSTSLLSVETRVQRSPIKQRFIDLERGVTLCLRGDSIFFIHIFSAVTIICTAIVLHATLFHWVMLFIAAMVVLASEIFHQALIHTAKFIAQTNEETAQKIQKISTAGEMTCILGATITILIILADCVIKLW